MKGFPSPCADPPEVERLGKLLADIRLMALDFDGVLTDNTVYVTQDGAEAVRCWRSDGIGLTRIRREGVHVLILSTEVNPVVTARANKLKIPCKQGVEDKAAAILAACMELGVDPRQAAFIGNDINDVPAFKVVGLPIGVADAYPEIFPHVLHRTVRFGGHGAVREVCDLIYRAKKGIPAGQEADVS
jgi:YrbI family 3-deoxy-D-manno-octulosonate 8-phosphate phosphatase